MFPGAYFETLVCKGIALARDESYASLIVGPTKNQERPHKLSNQVAAYVSGCKVMPAGDFIEMSAVFRTKFPIWFVPTNDFMVSLYSLCSVAAPDVMQHRVKPSVSVNVW